uniref:pumilio homolog 3-like n=1 Tax=Styela clava TaxID=7725 RepID=UPI001939B1B1|nr:pumilio homolog 3-like [Styela clava]
MTLSKKRDISKSDQSDKVVKAKKAKVAGPPKNIAKSDGAKNDDKTEKKLSKDTAATRKNRKMTRKMQKPNYELSKETLKQWEKLRRNKNKMTKAEKVDLVDELMKTVKKQDKKLVDLMYAHDTSRVLQSCLKQGNEEQRQSIYDELKSEIVNMSKNRYSKNMVWKFLKYGSSKQRDEIIHAFAGLVPKLIRKPGPASVIEFAYNIYANKEQRNFLVQQLYGNTFNVTKSNDSSTLEDVFKEQPEKKSMILGNFKQCLTPLVDKEVITHTIVHRVFNEFFTFCDEEQLRSEAIELLRDSVIHMMHTRDGAHVAMQCLWHGTAKDRKVIVRTMKEFIRKLCQEEYGHLALLAAFDSVDDTVFMNKALIASIVKMIPEIINNKYARKVLLYLISPRNKSHFLPETVTFLSQGDGNKHSKKPMETRHKELTAIISPGLVSYLKDNISTLARDKSLFMLVEAAINHCSTDVSELISALIELLSVPFEAGVTDGNGKLHLVEDAAGHLLVKRLISHKPDDNTSVSFAKSLLETVASENISSWCSCNRGSQVLLSLIQCPIEEVASKSAKMLKKNLKLLKKNKKVKSTELLIEKLSK